MDRPLNLVVLEGISCMSFNKDRSMCVLSKRDNNLYIYQIEDLFDYNKWVLRYTLKSVSLCYLLL